MPLVTHTFLRDHRDEIIAAWEQAATAEQRDVQLAGSALRDHLPELLQELATWLEGVEAPGASRMHAVAAQHAAGRLADAYQLSQLINEFRLLRTTILRLLLAGEATHEATGRNDEERRVSELARLNAGLDHAIADAVEQFVGQVDAAKRDSEQALRHSEVRFRALVERWAQVVWEAEPDGTVSDWTSWRAYTGQAVEQVTGDGWLDAVHPDDRASAERSWREALASRTALTAEFRIRAPEGRWRWTNVRATPVLNPDGSVKWVGMNIDITERKHAEEALRESEQRFRISEEAFRTLAESMPQIVWVTRPDGWNTYFNQHWVDYTGLTLEESYGHGWNTPFHPEDQRRAWDAWQAATNRGVAYDLECRLRRSDGAYRWWLIRGTPLIGSAGEVLKWVGTCTDIHQLKETKDAVERANAELAQADRNKSEFLAMLSHELRNPLAPILNSIYLLERAAPGSEQSTRAREVVRRQTEHLTRLVDDLLDVTRISHGKIPLERSKVDLREIVRRTTDDLHSVFTQAGITLRVDAAGPVWIEADATRMAQVLTNLLSNSMKFTPSGCAVRVSVAAREGHAELCVSDDGIGMDPKDIEHMFEPFAQADHSLARTKGGLGLGLALVKSVVELHGGTVAARSDGPGRGAEFLVRIPLVEAGAEPETPRHLATGTSARTILIIEDNVDGAQSLADILDLHGHRARVAHDGRSGIALAQELQPDVILCDIGLPDIDGYEVARTLRRDGPIRSTRLVALTGYAQPEDRQRARDAGFDAHLAKPVELDKLMTVLGKDS